MPSLLHEALVELFRNRPRLAAELLIEALSVTLPRFTEARIEPADLADVIPRELRADLLVLLLDQRPVLVILVEVQLSDDPDKLFTWPAYVAGARARYRCPACLLVVTPDAALAARLARPIVMGPGETRLVPFVLGPAGVPKVTEVAVAMARPELAVLSAMAHGRTEVGFDVASAALAASAGIVDQDRKALYADLVLSSLGEAARKAIEGLMIRNLEYQSEFARKYFADGREEGHKEGHKEGRREGHLEGQLDTLLHQFERRLRRTLSGEERERLAERVRERGLDPVSEVVLDMPAEALASWLATNNGH